MTPTPASILLVDDTRANLLALEGVLAPLGQRLVFAASGEEALRRLLEEDFALILMDVQMGGMDGYETAALLRQRQRSRTTPIIFLTATMRESTHLSQAYARGGADFLLKPFDPDILRSKVAVFVELHLAKEEVRLQAELLRRRELEVLEREKAEALARERLARREAELQRSHLRRLFMQSPALIGILKGPGLTLDFANATFRQVFGESAREGAPLLEAAPKFEPALRERLERVYREGEPFFAQALPLGGREAHPERLWNCVWQPMVGVSERVEGVLVFGFEVTELVQARREAERLAADLRVGEARFRRIVESNMFGLFFSSNEGEIFEANDAFLSMVGYSRAELAAGQLRWDALTPPEFLGVSQRALEELRARGTAPRFEKEYHRKGGGRVPVLMGSTRLEAEGRNLSFVIDITERKRAETTLRFLAEASELLSSSLEPTEALRSICHLAVPVLADGCTVDLLKPDGSVETVATAFADPERQRFLEAFQARGAPVLSDDYGLGRVLKGGKPEVWLDVDEAALSSIAPDAERRAMLRALGCRSLLMVPLLNRGRLLGALTLLQLESGRVYTEQDVRLAEDLARRAAAAVDNARLYQEAQAAVGLRDEFLSVASHELRTPLTPLHLKLQALRREAQSQGDRPLARERLVQDLAHAEDQVRKLASLVNDLLDVSRIRVGQFSLNLGPVDLAALLSEVASRFAPQAHKAGCTVEVRCEGLLTGTWDGTRLEQVVVNLLTNAIKYGPGQPIEMSAVSLGESVRLRVKDRGIGVAPEHHARIFGRFERAVSDRHYGGLGLGLYITRQIVEALGGSIRMESEPGKGATFEVVLPRDSRSPPESTGALTKR